MTEITRNCQVTVVTTADGKETSITKNGELFLCGVDAVVRYFDDNANVEITASEKQVSIKRQGDYSMILPLKEGEITDGCLGIGESEGSLRVHTHKLSYAVTGGAFLLKAQYALLFGTERQEMKIRLLAKQI